MLKTDESDAMDVNRDGKVTPLDALLVVNDLNRDPNHNAEEQIPISSQLMPETRVASSMLVINDSVSEVQKKNRKPELDAIDQFFRAS